MAFTKWYGMLIMALIEDDFLTVTAYDGNPYDVKPVKLYNKLSIGIDGGSLNPNDYKLRNEQVLDVATAGIITDTSSEVFRNVSLAWSLAGSITIREVGAFADCVDSLDNHYDVLIRRDLQSPEFVTNPSTSYTTMMKVSVSKLI